MGELTTVKVDHETHRLIGDLAHLLGRSRGAVVRDAVNAFASWRERMLEEGFDASAQRLAVATARHDARVADGSAVSGAGRIDAARDSPAIDSRLTVAERFERHHATIEREFAELGAHRPRIVDPRRLGYPEDYLIIAVEFDDPGRPTLGRLVLSALEWLGAVPLIVAAPDAP